MRFGKIATMLKNKCHIRKDDKVKIMTGKDKGKVGKILKINLKTGRVIVEKINMVKRHIKPNPQNTHGGIVDKEAPLDLSNVMLMCGNCMNPSRIRIKTLDDGKKVRECKKCNEIIDA
mmetsp:Transcript_22319/g.10712  ORF Transcript_22319/g.10712 Transcript_22319/m.10712 type:complete len:118 (+) Transcript_22319:5553-5906(+)